MIDETEQPSSDELELVPDRDIVTYDQDELDADDLYDIRREAEFMNEIAVASRVEIERVNAVANDSYYPKFGTFELADIGMVLYEAKALRLQRNETGRAQRIEDVSEQILAGFDIQDMHAVDLRDGTQGLDTDGDDE